MPMKTIFLDKLTGRPAPCAATIGFFDGVHLGHQYLIGKLVAEAHARKLEATIITFDCHPRQVLDSDYRPLLLNTLEEKLSLLASTRVDNCVVLSFNSDMASLSAHDFMANVLKDKLNVRMLAMGYDNRFGHNSNESFEDYVAYGNDLGIEVVRNDAYSIDAAHVNVSSSVVRSLLEGGEVAMAAHCLSYPYILTGEVIHGNNIGTGMGFPTANVRPLDYLKLVPAPGVYAVKVRLLDDSSLWNGMMNIGCRPTFDGKNTSLEVHLFDYHGDLYGRLITVFFVSRLRNERKFRNAGELTNQLNKDRDEAIQILGR